MDLGARKDQRLRGGGIIGRITWRHMSYMVPEKSLCHYGGLRCHLLSVRPSSGHEENGFEIICSLRGEGQWGCDVLSEIHCPARALTLTLCSYVVFLAAFRLVSSTLCVSPRKGQYVGDRLATRGFNNTPESPPAE